MGLAATRTPSALAALALACGVALACAHPKPGDDPLEALVSRVEEVREVHAERPVHVRVVTPEQMRQAIADEVVAHRTPQDLSDYQDGLVSVGLWPAGDEIFDDYVAVMGEEVAGLYLPGERALLVVGDPKVSPSQWLPGELVANVLLEETLAHEIVHLLQDQSHPELFEGDDRFFLAQDDAGLALQAAVEGDAMLYGMLAVSGSLPAPEKLDASLAESGAPGSALAAAPALIRQLLGFPYARGYRLALHERLALLDDPPASTEQVLHPELRHADFYTFDLGALSAVLPAGCRRSFENTVGEAQLGVLFDDLSGKPVDPAVPSGWDGDRYLAARCDGHRALLWITAWDTPADAREFETAYRQLAPAVAARAGLAQPIHVERRDREVLVASDDLAPLLDDLDTRAARRRIHGLAALRGDAEPGAEAQTR